MDNPVDGTATIVGSLQGWAKQPFTSTMSLSQWGLFTGLLIIIAFFWIMVLRDLKSALVG